MYIQRGNQSDCKVEVKEEIKEEADVEDDVIKESEFQKGPKNLNHSTMVKSSNYRNPSERCPRPLYSRDSTQEDLTIPHHHQVDGNPPERCPRPLYSRNSTHEDHTYAKRDQSGNLEDYYTVVVKEKFKEEDSVMEELSEEHKDLFKNMEPCWD
ncbi:uncharacterized protein ACMZJ9_022638 [Mantella aurantiaca]